MTGSPGSATTRRRADTRRRLVEAAYDLFVEVGINDARIEDICEHAGFTRGAFYSNFASKEELFLAMYQVQMDARADRLSTAVQAALAAVGDDVPDRVATVGRLVAGRFVQALAADVTWFPVNAEYRAQALRRPELRAPTAAAGARFEEACAAVLRELAQRLDIRLTVDARVGAVLVISLYEAMLERTLLAGGHVQPAEADAIADTLASLMAALTVPRATGDTNA